MEEVNYCAMEAPWRCMFYSANHCRTCVLVCKQIVGLGIMNHAFVKLMFSVWLSQIEEVNYCAMDAHHTLHALPRWKDVCAWFSGIKLLISGQ